MLIQNLNILPKKYIYVFRVYLSTKSDLALYIECRVFVTEADSVYCAVRTDSSSKMDYVSS